MINIRLPEQLEAGASAKPRYSTEIVSTDGGWEVRNSRWAYPKHEFSFSLSPGTKDDEWLTVFRNLFYAAGGSAEAFLFKHWSDFEGLDEEIGTGDGIETEFQLVKNYTAGAITRERKITRPVEDTVVIFADSVVVPGASVDYSTGIVTITPAPALNVKITADFEFDIPVRFEDDEIELLGLTHDLDQPVSLVLLEVRE